MKRISILLLIIIFYFCGISCAAFEQSIAQLYEKGDSLLKNYRGNPLELIEARDIFKKIIEKYPDSPMGYLGLSRYSVINFYRYDDHYLIPQLKEQALPYALKALSLGPLLPETHEQYAFLERIFERHANQQETLRQYMALFPDEAKTYFLVGEFLSDRKEFDLALEAFQKALRLNPSTILEHKVSKRIAGIYLYFLNNPARASQEYQDIIKKGEKSASLYQSLGIAQLELEDYASAVDSFQKALAITDSPLIRSYFLEAKGCLSQQEGESAKAVQLLQDALELSYERPDLLFILGKLLFQTENFTKAQEYFLNLIRIDPGHTEAYYFAGRIARSLGNKEQALGYFRAHLDIAPKGAEADWIRENIPELSQK